MRRSELLKVTVHCPHFNRPVAATRNAAIDRLCDCSEKDACRAPSSREAGEHDRPYPRGCPVFPSLSR
jgi:hypothetical protein